MNINSWIVLFSAIVLLMLIYAVKNSRRFNLYDHWLHHKLVHKRDGFKWQVIAFLNDPKLMVVWAVLLASLLINEERNITALWVLATLGFTDLVGIILKKSVHRQRPYKHSALEDGYSFPSGHVLGATTMVVISRLSLKAHYPSDILGATSLAIFCFSISQQIFLAI